jgi:hypothetical protein
LSPADCAAAVAAVFAAAAFSSAAIRSAGVCANATVAIRQNANPNTQRVHREEIFAIEAMSVAALSESGTPGHQAQDFVDVSASAPVGTTSEL